MIKATISKGYNEKHFRPFTVELLVTNLHDAKELVRVLGELRGKRGEGTVMTDDFPFNIVKNEITTQGF